MTMKYFQRMFDRLEPRTRWRGGRITHIDVLTLDEAAREASKHSGQDVTVADFLRAAARGEIRLRAIVRANAKVQKHDGGTFCNQGQPDENTVPKGAIPYLPLTACEHLANAGRASWRTFDGFVLSDDLWDRFTEARLTDDEPDFETVVDDCRVTGDAVHALADAYVDDEGAPADTTPPATEETPAERRSRLRARAGEMRASGIKPWQKRLAEEEGISASRLKQLLVEDANSVSPTSIPGQFAALLKR